MSRSFEIRGLSVPLQDAKGRRVGLLRVDHVSVESAKVGFMRIAVLPQWVVRGVRISLDSEGDCDGLMGFHSFLLRERALAGARLEGFEVLAPSGQVILRADSGKLSSDLGKIFLGKVLIATDGRATIRMPQAELHLSGKKAGLLQSIFPRGRSVRLCGNHSSP